MSVCSYNGLTTSSYVQNELLKSHTHFMTDDDFCVSPLYNQNHHKPPSPSELDRLHRIEKQNHYLKQKNHYLTFENCWVKFKSDMIKQNEVKLRTIINELPIPVLIRNQSSVLYFNAEAQKQFQIIKENVIGEKSLEEFLENYRHSSSNKVQEHPFILRDKKKCYLVKSIDILFETKPAILHSFVDITQEKENEILMIRSEKMNIAGELAASIAHELRNPLTAVKGFFHMIRKGSEEKEMYYQIIEDELSRIEQISSELLILAKPHSENRRDHNILQLITEVKMLLTPQSNMKSIEIVLQAGQKDWHVNCEMTKIKQVFINLIKNAIEAMEEGGRIVINVQKIEEEIQIKVIDHGSGIPTELLHKIGEPFYTTKEKGTGIGLLVCYQIIENHGGTIKVDSEVNVGTTFTIRLPASKEGMLVQSR